MTKLKPNKLYHITYTSKGKTETTERDIIPTNSPNSNIKALDVSELSKERTEGLIDQLNEYQQYRQLAMKSIFNFEDWIEHTSGSPTDSLKWRTFIPENLKIN